MARPRAAPQPCEPWASIRDTTSEANVSAQIDLITTGTYTGDEDCLYLNIYTPSLLDTLPVLFFVPGGGLIYGSGNTDLYAPDFLVEKDVIVVTINYRLGALGFISLNTPDIPGNAGLKDVVLALRWVKRNISTFGGDPENLTVFGESAGGAIVSVLITSPQSKDLISKAIMQSGTAMQSWFHQDKPVELARKLAMALGGDGDNLEEVKEILLTASAKEIVHAQGKISSFDDVLENPPKYLSMVVENELNEDAIITEPFVELVKSGQVAQIPIVIGTTALEFGFEKTSDDFQNFIPTELQIEKNSTASVNIADEIKKLYFKDDSAVEYCKLVSDKFINIDTHRYVKYLLQSTNIPIYIYKFDYAGKLNIASRFSGFVVKDQAMHGDDLGYLFKNDFQKDVEPTADDLRMRERMVMLWTNFAKTGFPTPDENPLLPVRWPPAGKGDERYIHLAKEITLGPNYDQEKMEFWDGLYEQYYKLQN